MNGLRETEVLLRNAYPLIIEKVKHTRGHRRTDDGHYQDNGTFIADKKVGRNDLCPCGSGKKYKNCCLGKASKEE